nr:TonB-dependent receptor [Cytophagaceae bacterium]
MRIPILLALLFFSQTFFAQSTPDQRVISVEELIDSTVTVGSFLDLDLQNSPVSITVITQDQIQNSGARHLSELLEIFVPGFQYLFNKWNGIIWGMRGVAADRNTKFIVLVNGHKMNHESRDGAYSELDLGFLSDLEKVEVLRGPAGLVYGSGSIAGVINLVTKRRNKVETVAEQSMETWALHTFGTSNKILVSRVVNEHTHAQLYGGFRISQGSGRGVPRLYGRPSWPYPQGHPSPPANGVPAEGSSWDTPGNFILSGELRLKDWKLYSRFTRQVTNATGMFVLDPWPEIAGAPDSTATPKLVDGVLAPRDGFWGTTESWGNSRRQYQVTNLSLQASRDFTLGIHQFKFRSGLDLVTNRIVFRKLSYFTNSLGNQPEFKYAETFGERRCNLTGTYLLNLSHFHLAAGLDSRIFFFGKDISGQNSQQDKAEHYIVDNVTYFNQAIFAESVLDYKKILIDLGIRYDLHSRTLNTRMGLVYKATKALNFRVIHHSSGNNGSADNYEFNRNTIDDYGNPYSEAHYETPYIKPTENSVPIEPVSLKELRRLKPEKASSTELASYFQNERWILGVSASYNTIKDLFTWNQVSFRTINAGKYNFVNAEWEIRYSQHAFTLGANHVISQLVNTE